MPKPTREELLEALRNIVASSEANDGDSLMNAIEDAKRLTK